MRNNKNPVHIIERDANVRCGKCKSKMLRRHVDNTWSCMLCGMVDYDQTGFEVLRSGEWVRWINRRIILSHDGYGRENDTDCYRAR